MLSPHISIVVRTFNRPVLLRNALESVAAQTFREFETLVVNDGGADVSDVVRPFAESARVRYLPLPRKVGRCAAANVALKEARGSHVSYLDDDDLYYPDHLQAHVDFVEANPQFKVTYSDANCARQRRRPDGTYETYQRKVELAQDFHPMRFFADCFIHIVTVVHSKECTHRLGGFDESLEVLEDHDLFFRLAQDYAFGHIARTTAEYSIRDDASNAVTAMRKEFVSTREVLFRKYFHIILPYVVSQYLRRDQELEDLKREVAMLRREIEAKRDATPGVVGKLFRKRPD